MNKKAKSLIKVSLATAVAGLMVSTAHANTEQQQIDQLRQEVATLKALVQQQQQVQQVQQTQLATVEQQTAAAVKKAEDLKFSTAGGSEIRLYGSIRGDANYIIEGADNDFNVVAASKEEATDKLRSTLKTTRIGIDFNKALDNGDKLGGKVETDFASSSEGLRIRHAYLTYNDWLFGQTTSTFLSNHAPEMIDFGTNVGGGTARIPMVRYGHKVTPSTQVFVALEEGDNSATGSTVKYSAPVLTAKVVQGFDEGKGSLSGRALVEHYKADVGGDDAVGYGAALGVNYQVTSPLKLSADYSYVKGNNKYLYGSNTAFALDTANQEIEQNEFHALQVGATYKFSPQLRSTLAYGTLLADDGTDYAALNAAGNEKVQQAWLNVIYSPVKPVDLGVEYVNGKRETFAGDSYNDNRVGLMARYSF